MISTLQRMSRAPDYAATTTTLRLWLEDLRDRWNARKTRRALVELSDEQLADIGLTRADIEAVARKVARQ